MSDYQAIVELLYRYAELVDGGDFEGVARLFEHGTITAAGSDHADCGHDAVLARYVDWTRRHADGTPRTKHVTSNPIVEISPDGLHATVRSYFTVLQQTAAVPLQPIIAGRYEDRMERVDGTWRFAHRHMIPELFGDLSDHLHQPIDRTQHTGGST
jgi:3-phenylpropionate/cinnamic acid dioxygenase small subunit